MHVKYETEISNTGIHKLFMLITNISTDTTSFPEQRHTVTTQFDRDGNNFSLHRYRMDKKSTTG